MWRVWIVSVAIAASLAACAPAGSGIQTQIDYAKKYVAFAEQVADTCVLTMLPLCRSVAVQEAIEQAKTVANEALDQAQQVANAGSDSERVQTLLRVAMNAVLMFLAYK